MITDGEGNVYLCNTYNKEEGGCIKFNDKPGYINDVGYPTKLCDNFKIKKLK